MKTLRVLLLALAVAGVGMAQGFTRPERPRHSVPARIRVRHHNATVDSQNWSGYAVSAAAGSVTDVTASWIVPPVSCPADPSAASVSLWVWVGIDGFTSSTVEQIGTASDCWNGVPLYYVWYEFYPGAPATLFDVGMDIDAGHIISAEVKSIDGQFTVSIADAFTGKAFSMTQTVSDAMQTSAEWIAEAPESDSGVLPLSNFNFVLFGYDKTGVSNTCSATIDGIAGSIGSFAKEVSAITMVANGVDRVIPLALSADGTAFSVVRRQDSLVR